METIIIKINPRSKAGKVFSDLVQLFSTLPGIEIVQEKSPYNPEFVRKIKESEKQIKKGEYVVLNSKDIWGSLELL